MQKWDYCLLRQHSGESWIISRGARDKIKGDEGALIIILTKLGNDGWEAVNFIPNSVKPGSYTMWPFTGEREILFKRPIEN